MPETLTYDAGTDTVTQSGQLTEAETESLKVGEELINQQEGLLAGKYKDAEALEKAYIELEGKLGKREESETTNESADTSDTSDTSEAPDNYYAKDGSVNYDTAKELYGDQIGDLVESNQIDPFKMNQHYEKEGSLTDDMYASLGKAGFNKEIVDSYLAGLEADTDTDQQAPADLTDSDITSLKNSVGGEEAYDNLTNWAQSNLPQKSIDAFDELVSSGSTDAIQLAITGLKSQYDNANGYEGTMVTGKAPTSTKDVYRSQAELVEAMSDKRYDRDPAYRQDVIAKLERSNNLQF